jgi:PPK2 family polyphosphate:nucleotide phosphotransferase
MKVLKNKIDIDDFRAKPGKTVRLKDWPTELKPIYKHKEGYQALLAEQIAELSKLQDKLYADNRYSLLMIFQAMDAAGKDSAIKHLMSGVNPQGCQVFSFKHPSAEELDHDFLWRTTRSLPERGRIGIFNRSYYEEVLIVRVHPEILKAQCLPPDCPTDQRIWKERYRSIVDFEAHLDRNGTRIVKFFLHISKDEQRKRFLKRIDEPEKNWKFSVADLRERALWKDYQEAYEDCFKATSTTHAPWYIVPGDDKANARLILSEIILSTLQSLPIRYPKISPQHQKELLTIRDELTK